MRVEVSREVGRSAGEVFEFFADASNNPRWQDGMVSCEWLTEAPIGVGSRYRQVARFAGRDIKSVFVVTALNPGVSISIETLESTFPIQVERRVEDLGDGRSRVSAEITGGPEKGILRLIEPLLAKQAARSIKKDYDRLVQLLGARAT